MAFRFVKLRSKKMPALPANSPILKSGQSKLEAPKEAFFVGMLQVHRVTGQVITCIRQEPIFLRQGFLGICVPSKKDLYDYAGISLGKPNSDAPKEMPIVVEFNSFDDKFVNSTHLDLVKNFITPGMFSLQNKNSNILSLFV